MVTAMSDVDTTISSLPQERFVQRELALSFACKICADILTTGVCETVCKHIFCKHCITPWLQPASVYPHCETCLEADTDVNQLQEDALESYEEQLVKCRFESTGCKTMLKLSSLAELQNYEI